MSYKYNRDEELFKIICELFEVPADAKKVINEPKYKYYDKVLFKINNKEIEGYIYIIDKYGTFEQNEEPSYDIFEPTQNMLYKHCRESNIISFISHTDEKTFTKIYESAIKNYNLKHYHEKMALKYSKNKEK